MIAAFTLGRLAINMPMDPQPLRIGRLASEIVFYFFLVGLIYLAFEVWIGTGAAVLGSALAFGLFHIG